MDSTRKLVLSAVLLSTFLALSSCGGGSGAPAKGSPEWYWEAAQGRFDASDHLKVQEHLKDLAKDEGDMRKRAAAWRLVVVTGLARGYLELGNAYADGAKKNAAKAAAFRNSIQQYRRDSRQYAIDLAESIGPFLKLTQGDASIPLDFNFPSGGAGPSGMADNIRGGIVPTDVQQAEVADHEVRRAVLLQTAALTGAGEEVNVARPKFETRPVEIPRQVFLNALARSAFLVSDLFDRTRLNQPDIKKILIERARDCLKAGLESEDEEVKKQAEAIENEIQEKEKSDEKIRKRLRRG